MAISVEQQASLNNQPSADGELSDSDEDDNDTCSQEQEVKSLIAKKKKKDHTGIVEGRDERNNVGGCVNAALRDNDDDDDDGGEEKGGEDGAGAVGYAEFSIKEPRTSSAGGDDTPEDYVPPWKTCISICAAFLITYSAFEAIQNLQSSLNSEGQLGETSLSLMYVAVVVGSFLGPAGAKLVGHKNLILGSFVVHLTYTCLNFSPTWLSLLSISAVLGVAVGCQAMSQAVYIASVSTSYIHFKKLPQSKLYATLSLFNGLFYCCFKGTQIVGNLITSGILFSQSEYNTTLLQDNKCGAQLCAADFNAEHGEVFDKPDQSTLNLLFGSFALLNVTGILVIAFVLPPLKNVADDQDDCGVDTTGRGRKRRGLMPFFRIVRNHIGGCVSMLLNPKFALLAPLTMANSMIIMILYTGYTKAFVTCTVGVQWVGYCMVALGVSSSIVALLVSYIARYTGRVFQFVVGMGIDISTIFIMLLWVPDYHVDPALLFIVPLMAGTAEGVLQPQLQVLFGGVFTKAELPSAYAAFNGVKCLAFSIYLTVEANACLWHCLMFALSLYVPGVIGYAYTEYREIRKGSKRDGAL